MMRSFGARRLLLLALVTGVMSGPGAQAADLMWKGRTWHVTSGGMAGVCDGDPANVSVDASGFLHFKITNNGGKWTASEIFTTDALGFGTYQWQVDGPVDTYDPNVVLGLYPYGPAAGIGKDGTNEIDIEYSRWGHADGPNGDWTNYPASGTTIGETSYTFSLGGATLSTSRFRWTPTSIQDFLMSGLEPVDGTTNLIKTWTYAPPNPTVNIPQQALPLGMNLWCFDAPPSDGKDVEIVIRDFTFVPAGAAAGDAGVDDGGNDGGHDASAMTGGGAGVAGSAGAGGGAGGTGTAGAAGSAGAAGMVAAGAGASAPAGATGSASAGQSGGGAGAPGVSGAAGVTPAETSTSKNGCACAVPAGSSAPLATLLVALVAYVGAIVRRRRRRRPR
jgi:hypothetical protein